MAVTQVYPSLQPELLSTFTSKADLISVLLASCYIPWWFDGRLVTPVRNRLYCDGGILNFLPATPGVGRSVRVCCLPASQLPRALSTDIHPGVSLTGTTEMWPHDLSTMLGWAFQPADDHMLLALADHGREDARAWALAEGLVTPDAAAANDKQHQQQQQTKQQLQTQPLPPPPGVALGSGTVFASSNGGSPPPPAPPQPAPTSSTSSPAGASS